MSNKFDLLMTILNKLDRKEPVTRRSLMDDMGIGERSVFRYIQTLQTAGFPIYYSRAEARYVFADGFSLGKPNISLDEQLAISLAKTMLGAYGTGMEKSLSAIEKKLIAQKRTGSSPVILQSPVSSNDLIPVLHPIHEAITNYQRIEIKYHAHHKDEITSRKVDPYYLFFHDGLWYLRAYCHMDKEMRTFALDAIKNLKVLSQHFIPEEVSAEEELSEAFGTWLDGEATEIVLHFDKEVKRQVLRKKWHKSQKEKELKNGGVELRFKVKGFGGIKKWIYQWIPNVRVVAPKRLRRELTCELDIARQKL